MRHEGCKGVVLVRGLALYGIYALLAVVETAALHYTLSCPGAVEGDEIILI